MAEETQTPQEPRPDWIAATIGGEIKQPSDLRILGLKANDFTFESADNYWKTPVIQEHFKNDKDSFVNFYSQQKQLFDDTKKSDYELDFNIEVATDKWSRRPLVAFSTKSETEDPFGRNQFGDYYSPAKYSEREQAIDTGIKIGEKYVPISGYKGEIKLAKDENGVYKRNEKNRTYWEPVQPGEELKTFDETYSSFAHNMGIYGLKPSYLAEGFYTVSKSIPNFINRTSDSLLELPRVLGADVSAIQNEFRENMLPSSDRTKENFLGPISLLELGLDSVWQLLSMGAVGKVAGVLSGSAKTASTAGRIYMTGMAAGPMARISRENNLSASETAILYGAMAAATYKISALSDWAVRGIRPMELEKIVAPKLLQDYGVTVAKKGFTDSALKSFQNRAGRTFESAIVSLSSKPIVRGAFLESTEEVLEQSIDSGLRGLHNITAELFPLQGRFQWDLGREMEGLFQSAVGGALGGAIAQPLLKKMGSYERELVDSFETAVAFNDESIVLKMVNDWEKSGRLSKDGKLGEENTRNATALKEILNTMVNIRDKAGIRDAIKNNEKKAGVFADILKASSIGRDKIVLQNELATLNNQFQSAANANNEQEVKNLTTQIEAKKAQIAEFNSGSQVARYITEGLYNVESNPALKSPIIDAADLGIDGLSQFALANDDRFNGKLFTLMNIDSRSNKSKINLEINRRNQELLNNSNNVTLENFESMDITPDASQRLLDQAVVQRNVAVENFKNSGVADIINNIFADDEYFDASIVYTDPQNSFRYSQEVLKNFVEPYKNEAWYSNVAPLFEVENLINKIRKSKRVYEPSQEINQDAHLYYDFENGKSGVPLQAKLDELLSAAGLDSKLSPEESDRLSKMFVSSEPERLFQVIDDRIKQVLGNYALKKKGYDKDIIGADINDVKTVLETLAQFKGLFTQLKNLSEENENNTDVRILQVYINSLKKQFNTIQNFVKNLQGDFTDIESIFGEYEADMQEALDKQDYVKYRQSELQLNVKLFDNLKGKKDQILAKLQKTFKSDVELKSDEGILAKNTYDYARGILSNDVSKFTQASREVISEIPEGVKTPTREHLFVAEMALRNAMAGGYNFRQSISSRELLHLSYTSSINGGPGTGKTVTLIPLVAGMVNKMTSGNVIVTAFKDSAGRKINKVRTDVESFYKKKPEFIQYSDLDLLSILKSDAIKNTSAIIFDEAGLISRDELKKINDELIKINNSRPDNPVHIFYTYDEFQNGYRLPNQPNTIYSITSPSVSVPSTPRLTFSFRSVNGPLKALENTLRNSQFTSEMPSDIALNYDKDFNGVRFVNNKEELDKLVTELGTKLKNEKNLASMVYINADLENTPVPSASALSIYITNSIESQGDEWDYVVVDTTNGEIFGNDVKRKEFYTAVTRAKKGVIVYAAPSMPVSSVQGVVKEFKPITPPEISQQTMLQEIDAVLSGQKVDATFSAANTIKPDTSLSKPSVQSMPGSTPPPVTAEQIFSQQELIDDIEKSDYQRILSSVINTENSVLLNTFFDVEGEEEIKKSVLFNPEVRDKSNYQLVVAKIGSPGYELTSKIDSSKHVGKYALFFEAVTPDNKRAVLGVVYKSAQEPIDKVLRNLNIISANEQRDVVATYPVSSNVLRASKFFHPFIVNEQFTNDVTPDGKQKLQEVPKKNLSEILSEANAKGVSVSKVLIATSDIVGRNGKVVVKEGEPFLALSSKYSQKEMLNMLNQKALNIDLDHIETLTLDREFYTIDQVVELFRPYYRRNSKGYLEPSGQDFENLYNSFWQSVSSKGKRTYEQIFEDVTKKLSATDPQVRLFLQKVESENPTRKITYSNGKEVEVKGGYSVSFLLSDYVQSVLETDSQRLQKMNAEPKRKIFFAMLENKAFANGLRFSPLLQKGSSGKQETKFGLSVNYNNEFLRGALFAKFFRIDPPKIQMPIDSLLSEISESPTQEQELIKASEKTPSAPATQVVGRVEGQPKQESVQGTYIPISPISLIEFVKKEFPTQPAVARQAIDKFKKDVIASHLLLSVPEKGTPRILSANEAMQVLKKKYLSNSNRLSQNTSTESRIQYALGANFNGLLANYFPAIKYDSVKDSYSYSNEVFKSKTFAEKESENLLVEGINSIVKTYLYNTQLTDGRYLTSNHIKNVLKLVKSSTNSQGLAIRTISEMANVLGNSSLPEARAIYERFFSPTPKIQGANYVYSTRSVDTPAGQSLTNAILMFLNRGQVYTPGLVEINISTDQQGNAYEQRTPKLPISGFNPVYIKTMFVDKFQSILSNAKISIVGSDINFNGELFKVESTVSPESALRMIKATGFEGFTPEMLAQVMQTRPNAANLIQDYFFKTVKLYNKNKTTPSLGLIFDDMIELFISNKGLGNDFSFIDGNGKKQHGLRDSAPIFHINHAVRSAQSSPVLSTLLIVDPASGYSISTSEPFTHLGFKINKDNSTYSKSVSQLSVPELLELFLIEGYVSQIEAGRNEVAVPVTVYADAGQEITPIFSSNNLLQPAEKTIGDLFDSRTKYFVGLEAKILKDYSDIGINARSIEQLNKILQTLPIEQIDNVLSSANIVSGTHYDEKSVKGPLRIKESLINDLKTYTNPANKESFIGSILADAEEIVKLSKNRIGSTQSLYDTIARTSTKATPEEFIKTFYANWLLFSGEFQQLMNGPRYQYKESGQRAFIDMVKRSKSLISPEAYFVLRDSNWNEQVAAFRAQNPGKPLSYSLKYEGKKLSRNPLVMRFEDPIQPVTKLSNGKVVGQKWMDGATLTSPFTRIKQNHASGLDAGPFTAPVMKNITHSNDFESGTKSFVKNAEFEITPFILANGNEFAIEKFIQMTSIPFPQPIQVNQTLASNAYEVLIGLGMNPDFSNAMSLPNVFEEAMDILVENGYQDLIVDEAIFQSSEKTGQRGVNKLSNPNPKVSTIDITMKGIQQDGSKDPSQGMEINVLTQLVNAISINWVNAPVLEKFYNTLSNITKSYIQDLSKLGVAERVKYFTEIMRDDLLATDGSNYRTEAAYVNRLSINDRTIAPKYTQTIATDIKDAAVAFGLQGGHFVIHPSLMDVYEVEELGQPPITQPTIDADNAKTPIEGLNERVDSYGDAKVLLSSDFYEGARPVGRLNSFKSSITQVADNIIVLADLNLNEFNFLSEEDKKRLDGLRPLAKELQRINVNDISSSDRRTVSVEKRYAALSNQLANEFVDIIGKHVEQQLGKKITSSKPRLSAAQPIVDVKVEQKTNFNPTRIDEKDRKTYADEVLSLTGPIVNVKVNNEEAVAISTKGIVKDVPKQQTFDVTFQNGDVVNIYPHGGSFTGMTKYFKDEGSDIRLFAGVAYLIEKELAQAPTTQPSVSTDAKANIKGRIAGQGTSIELEVVGDTGKEFLLFIDRNSKGEVELYSEKKDWGDGTFTYRPGEGDKASKEQINKLYNKYIPESVRNLITEWQNSFVGSWAAPETEDGKNHRAIEKRLDAELDALEGKAVIATATPTASKTRIVLKSQLGQFDPNRYRITQRKLKWQDPIREDGVSLSQLYATGVDQQTINNSLQNDKWSKAFAEILLPAEMMEDFQLKNAIKNNIPIDSIDEKYFLSQILTDDEAKSNIIPKRKQERAKLMFESFQNRLEGVMARIPTSGKHSGIATKIVGFFEGSMNSVSVPADLFTVQGADQDYDKGSYITYQAIKEYVMVDPSVKNGREVRTYDPTDSKYSHLRIKEIRPTGLIPFEDNFARIKEVKNFSKDDIKQIEKIIQKNELVKAINSVLSDSKSVVELNTTTDDVMGEIRALANIALESTTEADRLRFDHLISMLKIHELNQAGGKNIVGVFANGAKAYNVINIANRMRGINVQGEDTTWKTFASLISAAVDNANEGVLGPLKFDEVTAPYISMLAGRGMSITQIAEFVNANQPFFNAIRDSKKYNSPQGFNVNAQPLALQNIFYQRIEWDVLSQSLTNRDIPITMEDIASHILSLENYVNMSYRDAGIKTEAFDFERFFSDDQAYINNQLVSYRQLISNTQSHLTNILGVFATAPHMRGYQQAIMQAHKMFKDINAYNKVYDINKQKLADKINFSEDKILKTKYRYRVEDFKKDYDTIHGMYIHGYLNSRDTSTISEFSLNTYAGRMDFIKEVNGSLTNLKSRYPDNEFVKDLTLEKNSFTGDSRIRMYDFYDMNDDLRALYMEEFGKLDQVDRRRLFLYNLIVTRDRNSKGSFTSLISISDKADYINFLDFEVNIPLESLQEVIAKREVNESLYKGVSEQAIPYDNFKYDKKESKVLSKTKVKLAKSNDWIPIEIVSYIDDKNLQQKAIVVNMKENNPVIQINEKALEVNFLNRIWTKSYKLSDGTVSTGLPYNTFETLEEYRQFLIEFNYLVLKNGATNQNGLIQQALINVGKNKFIPYRTNKDMDKEQSKCDIPNNS